MKKEVRVKGVKIKIKESEPRKSKTWVKQTLFFVFVLIISFAVFYYLNLKFNIFSLEKSNQKNFDQNNPQDNKKISEPSENGTDNNMQGDENISSQGGSGTNLSRSEEDSESDTNQIITKTPPQPNKTIIIGSWNLLPLDEEKAENAALMQTYASIIDDYDIMSIQGITSSNAFDTLCSLLPKYNCIISSESQGERYGIVYKNMTLLETHDFNPDNKWLHPPLEVKFNISDYNFRIYTLNTNPDDVNNELSSLESIVAPNGNMIILGDLNADCSYYNPSEKTEFTEWYWITPDNADTIISSEDCAYDRIIVNSEANGEFAPYELGNGVYSAGITSDISGHYIVWIEIRPEEQS